MEINDVLIASYLDGTATIDERNAVRKYLCVHPEMYARVLLLMDNDREDYLNEASSGRVVLSNMQDDIFSDLEMSSAAFAAKSLEPQVINSLLNGENAKMNRVGSDEAFCKNGGFPSLTYRRSSHADRMTGFLSRLDSLCGELDEIEDI